MTCLVQLNCPWNTPGQQLDLEVLYKRLLFWSCWSLYCITRNCNSIMQHVQQEARNYGNNGWCWRTMLSRQSNYGRNHLDSRFIGTFNSLSPKGHERTFSGCQEIEPLLHWRCLTSAWSEFMATNYQYRTDTCSWMMSAAKQRCCSCSPYCFR